MPNFVDVQFGTTCNEQTSAAGAGLSRSYELISKPKRRFQGFKTKAGSGSKFHKIPVKKIPDSEEGYECWKNDGKWFSHPRQDEEKQDHQQWQQVPFPDFGIAGISQSK